MDSLFPQILKVLETLSMINLKLWKLLGMKNYAMKEDR